MITLAIDPGNRESAYCLVDHRYSPVDFDKVNNGNVIQALVDRFTPHDRNRGKGTKAKPGFFYGFAGDIWQAYALAVYAIDTQEAAA